ncbi:uncharacterized protein LOC135137878 [Zophobas morio]|uniref:uncharacterized protein LOC135137878 n=1 Tax=Zophobas morio TaxID=2755281 RepID=UPI00308315F5
MKLTYFVAFFVAIATVASHGNKRGWGKHHPKKDIDDDSSGSFESTKNDLDRLSYYVNAHLGLHFPYSRKHQKVAVLDHRHNTSVFYDGLSGDAFAFSYEEGIGVYIPGGVSDKTWNIKETSFEKYFKNPVLPKEIFSIGQKQGYQFDPQLISDEMSEKLSGILTPLSIDYSSRCEALATALHISKITSDKLKTSLSSFESVMGDVSTQNRGDFKWLIGIYQGLGEFFAPFGSMEILKEKKLHLDFAKILNEDGGISVLGYLLETLAPHFDLGKLIGEQMNSEPQFFVIINKLGGEVDYCSDGLVYVLTEITIYNYGETSKENLVTVLRKFFTDTRVCNENLEQKWLSSIKTLLETIQKLKLENSFKDLSKLLKDIGEGKWQQNCVNMSEVFGKIVKVELPGKADSANEIIELLEKKN